MRVVFFGNRGSRPLGASDDSPFSGYGGDTTAIGILFDDGRLLALDAGSGFWKWDYTLKNLLNREPPYELDLFLTHYHDDHIMGLAQSALLFHPGNKIGIHGPNFYDGVESVFDSKANPPYNPKLTKAYRADISFTDLTEKEGDKGRTLSNGARLTWLAVPHGAEQSYGYRIDHEDRSFCFISDTHHQVTGYTNAPVVDEKIVEFIRGTNMLTYDCHYSDAEFSTDPKFYQIMGHSTGEHGVRLCQAAGIPLLVTHHHNPNNDDATMDKLTQSFRTYGAARNVYVMAAKPSLTLDLNMSPISLVEDALRQGTAKARWEKLSALKR